MYVTQFTVQSFHNDQSKTIHSFYKNNTDRKGVFFSAKSLRQKKKKIDLAEKNEDNWEFSEEKKGTISPGWDHMF